MAAAPARAGLNAESEIFPAPQRAPGRQLRLSSPPPPPRVQVIHRTPTPHNGDELHHTSESLHALWLSSAQRQSREKQTGGTLVTLSCCPPPFSAPTAGWNASASCFLDAPPHRNMHSPLSSLPTHCTHPPDCRLERLRQLLPGQHQEARFPRGTRLAERPRLRCACSGTGGGWLLCTPWAPCVKLTAEGGVHSGSGVSTGRLLQAYLSCCMPMTTQCWKEYNFTHPTAHALQPLT